MKEEEDTMTKIGLFWGSDTGNTETVAGLIAESIGNDNVDLIDVSAASKADMEKYRYLILGTPTWYDGELQSDWASFLPNMDEIDFSKKTVALFGLGDQFGYSEYFLNGMGELYDKLIERSAKVVGQWPTDGYEFDESTAVRDGMFVGLALDQDNQQDKTEERIKKWVEQVKPEFGL